MIYEPHGIGYRSQSETIADDNPVCWPPPAARNHARSIMAAIRLLLYAAPADTWETHSAVMRVVDDSRQRMAEYRSPLPVMPHAIPTTTPHDEACCGMLLWALDAALYTWATGQPESVVLTQLGQLIADAGEEVLAAWEMAQNPGGAE